ncbi:MAG: CapA family protein [Thermoleophilaceae bacterium]
MAAAAALAAPAVAGAQASNPRYDPPTVQLGWSGDMAFGRDYGLPPGGPESVLTAVRSRLEGTELMAGNLEGTLGSGGPSKCGGGAANCFAFQAPASYARGYRRSGFDVVNLANNHTNDFGSYGMEQTLAALDHAHLPHAGRPGGIKVIRSEHRIRVAYVGFAPYDWAADLRDIDGAQDLVREAAARADVVVVMMHAGAEGSGATHVPHGAEYAFGEYRGETRRFARAVVKAGADLVVGSGPHVLRGIECYRDRVIAYSLGNFAGYHTFATGGVLTHSGILRVELDRDGSLVSGRLLPVRFGYPGTPRPGGGSVSFVRRLSREDFGDRACRISHHGYLKLP